MDVTKAMRGEWLGEVLSARGVDAYGRAATICKDIGCSNAVASGWLRGSLPKDMELAFKFCDQYEISLRAWVYCIADGSYDPDSDSIPGARLESIISQARCFEREHGGLTDGQMAHVIRRLNAADNPKQELQQLGEVVTLFSGRGKNNEG